MRVTLAYPVEGLGGPNDVVEVDDERGRVLIQDGKARGAGNGPGPKTTRARSRNTTTEEVTADGR